MFWCVAAGTRRSFNHFSISNSYQAAGPNRGVGRSAIGIFGHTVMPRHVWASPLKPCLHESWVIKP